MGFFVEKLSTFQCFLSRFTSNSFWIRILLNFRIRPDGRIHNTGVEGYLKNEDHINVNIKDDEEEGDRVRTRVCGQVTSVSGGRVEVSVLRNGNGYRYPL
jgi:hypothetical protein